MIIIVFELYLAYRLVGSIKKQSVDLSALLAVAILFQAILLLLYRTNLVELGRIVYYSDAEYYWQEVQILLGGGQLSGSQVGYAFYSYAIQVTSPFESVIWNNISNIMLVNLSVLIIAKVLQLRNVSRNNTELFVKACLFNPLVYYSLMRNLKDALFLFLVVCIVYFYIQFTRKPRPLSLMLALVLTAAVATVRPWGFLVLPALAIEALFQLSGRQFLRVIVSLIVVFGCSVLVIASTGLWAHVDLWAPIVFENAGEQSILGLLLAPFNILMGPGPYRSILGAEYWQYYTDVGNVMCAAGSLMWWASLSLFASNIRKIKLKGQSLSFLIICLLFLIIYSMQYGGGLELRFRGVIYILFSAAFISCCKSDIDTKLSVSTVVTFIVILVVGTAFSI